MVVAVASVVPPVATWRLEINITRIEESTEDDSRQPLSAPPSIN